MTSQAFRVGDSVRVTDWGVEKRATVTRVSDRSDVIWVRMADTGRNRWFFASNLTREAAQ